MLRTLATLTIAASFTAGVMASVKAIAVPPTPGSSQTMIGCLQRNQPSAGFRLSGVQGGAHKQVQIDSVAPGTVLETHTGHKVAITGTLVETGTAGKTPVAGKPAAAEPRIRVLSVKMVSATCSV